MRYMTQYIIFNLKEEVENFSKAVDLAMGYPKVYIPAGTEGDEFPEQYLTTFATPIKKYNVEKYAYPVTEAILHLIPAEKEVIFDLGSWYPDTII
jgi:hypothetical protein